jgi:hypothetical protein
MEKKKKGERVERCLGDGTYSLVIGGL